MMFAIVLPKLTLFLFFPLFLFPLPPPPFPGKVGGKEGGGEVKTERVGEVSSSFPTTSSSTNAQYSSLLLSTSLLHSPTLLGRY